ncbi:unnamed protein product [Blepharisma stoltei]|uniref:PX domain-containing protein n=1 Tax=Blepharisma stoltei TaxID=1481888 RepID=A0AAU9K389_9CILI|nr:unnamed protein product [Blepharisma stoltei]
MNNFSNENEEFKDINPLTEAPLSNIPHKESLNIMDEGLDPSSSYEEETIVISVINPVIKEERLGSHVNYTIMGQDSKGTFEACRRYKDFKALRDSLIDRWPGCFIPQIPPKQAIGNLDPQFIEQRRKLLEYFLTKSSSYSYIFRSPEFNLFIRSEGQFRKNLQEVKKLNYTEIAQNFKEEFPNYITYQISEDLNNKIEASLLAFQSGIAALNKFEEICKENVINFAAFEIELLRLMKGIQAINIFYKENFESREVNVLLRDSYTNPYQILLDWIRKEVLDLEAMIDLVAKQVEYNKIKGKYEDKLDESKLDLEKMHQGKKLLSQRLSRKPKEHHLSKIEGNIDNLENDIKSLNLICKIITARIIEEEIPKFREHKQEKYEMIMRAFTNSAIQEFENLINQNKVIENSLNY